MSSSFADDAPWRAISPSWGTARRLSMLVLTVVALAVASGILALIGVGVWWWVLVLGPIALVGLFQIANSGRVCRARQYAEAADELFERHGLLVRSRSVVPYGRLQSVDVTQGPYERLLGLASVRLQTASLVGAPVVRGLEEADAHALADRLTARAKERQWAH